MGRVILLSTHRQTDNGKGDFVDYTLAHLAEVFFSRSMCLIKRRDYRVGY